MISLLRKVAVRPHVRDEVGLAAERAALRLHVILAIERRGDLLAVAKLRERRAERADRAHPLLLARRAGALGALARAGALAAPALLLDRERAHAARARAGLLVGLDVALPDEAAHVLARHRFGDGVGVERVDPDAALTAFEDGL